MSATNPFRVSDLIAKYGWKIMPYLSNLGPQLLAEAQVLFVDSGHTNALDADDTEHGHSFEKPLATWDYAVGLCTASEASVIFLAPGHNENLGAAQIDLDVIGVHTIGIGSGSLKPRIDFENAASSINVGANNVTIQNIDFLPSVPAVLIGVHVETDVTNFRMKDVRFLIGEDGSGADEFVKAVEMTSGNDDCVFEDVIILAHDSAGGATHGIHIDAASDRLVFKNVIIDGPYATGGIVEDAAGVNHILVDCAVDVSGTNYDFDGSSTFAKRIGNISAGTLESQVVGEITGDADIDEDQADYTSYVNILTVTAPANGLVNCRIDLDFNKSSTGWDNVATAADTLDVIVVIQVDGTNYRSTQKASAQIVANGNGTLDASESGISFDIGPMGSNASVQIHVKESAERGDVEIPYRVTYVGAAPTVTAVAAA